MRAYNAHDLDEFIAYAETAVVEDADGRVLLNGREAMQVQYGRIFDASPRLQADVVARLRVSSYVVDEEHVRGKPGGDLHAIAIYQLNEQGLIDRVRFLR